MSRHVFIFTVEGSGEFPIDMLRRDECFPNGEQDSYRIQEMRDRRTIYLIRTTDNRFWTPTGGRWESFGWKVTGMEEV